MDNVLGFKGYKIKEIEFKTNENFYLSDSDEVDLDLDFDMEKKIVDTNLELTLTAKIFQNCEELNKPFTIKVSIIGYFKFEDNLSDEIKKNLINVNAVAILYPYLRMLISNITANGGINPIILPVVNIAKFLEKKYNK